MTNEITRENVQQILDRNSAEARRKEADLYEQERQLRKIINKNHTTNTITKPQLAQQRAKEAEEARNAELAKRQERRAELAQEAEGCTAWYRFMLLVFGPLILAGMMVSIAGSAPITIPLLLCMAAYVALILVISIKSFFPKPNIPTIKILAEQTWPKVKECITALSFRKKPKQNRRKHHGN